MIVVGGKQANQLIALDASSGKLEWNMSTSNSIETIPVFAPDGSIVYFGNNDNKL